MHKNPVEIDRNLIKLVGALGRDVLRYVAKVQV